ncbi:hypothetical protein PENTCL1PPCAC_29309, partial [Pristionchus entomophagus]
LITHKIFQFQNHNTQFASQNLRNLDRSTCVSLVRTELALRNGHFCWKVRFCACLSYRRLCWSSTQHFDVYRCAAIASAELCSVCGLYVLYRFRSCCRRQFEHANVADGCSDYLQACRC